MPQNELMRIGIYGGTFDPPHYGHVVAAAEAARKLELDKLFVIPANFTPRKADVRQASNTDRLAMTELAFAKIPGAVVSDIELEREGPSYTADTLDELAEQYPDAQFFLLLGADTFTSMQSWVRSDEIFARCTPVAFSRDEDQQNELIRHAGFLMERYGAHCEVLDSHVLPASSTEIREALRKGEKCEFLQDSVAEYIAERRLYRDR